MVIPIIAMGKGRLLKGAGKIGKKILGKKVGGAIFGRGRARKRKWTIEKGMKQLIKAKIQGKILKARYGSLVR